ncbi:MAG TPA: peptidoglycan-binding domain-containing protein [Candidatus Acidoferrales bacterium]|nr:peptidoglycan-binding domain-containing protein [Candidatus Acidoferrales bacterium]
MRERLHVQSLLTMALRMTKRGLAGVALLALAFCFASLRTNATRHLSHRKAPASHKATSGKSSKSKARLLNASYKAPTHKRRHRRKRHHVTLPKQPSADRTEEIQSALKRGGFYSGNPNGKWDNGTQESLRRFQTAKGLPPTGKLDALSLQKLGLGSDVAGLSAPRAVTPGNSSAGQPPAQTTASPSPKTPGF